MAIPCHLVYTKDMTKTQIARPDNYTSQAVEMIDLKGKRHLVARVADITGELNWCSRKYIATRDSYSGSWLQVDITGWTLASMAD